MLYLRVEKKLLYYGIFKMILAPSQLANQYEYLNVCLIITLERGQKLTNSITADIMK